MGESRIAGVLRANGALSAEVQKIVRMHCERGNVQEMVVSIADYLLSTAMVAGRVPHNVGVKTQDLLDRTEEALKKETENYHQAGGVLVAKGYIDLLGLTAEMAKQWLEGFSQLQETREKDIGQGLADPEIQDRLTVVALVLRKLLSEKSKHEDRPVPVSGLGTVFREHWVVDTDDVEGICNRAAITMLQAFNEPNAANHEIVHGKKP